MKTKKNKTTKDIAIAILVGSSLFHWFVVVATYSCLSAYSCPSAQKSSKPSIFIQEKQKPTFIPVTVDESDQDITDQVIVDEDNAKEQFDENKQAPGVYSDPSEGSHKANQEIIIAENGLSRSSSRLDQRNELLNGLNQIAPVFSQTHFDSSNKVTDQNQEMDSGLSSNVQGCERTAEQCRSLDENLPPLLEQFKTKLNGLKNHKIELIQKYEENTYEKGDNYKELIKRIDALYEGNDFTSMDYVDKLRNVNQEDLKKYEDSTLKFALDLNKDLDRLVKQQEKKAKRRQKNKHK